MEKAKDTKYYIRKFWKYYVILMGLLLLFFVTISLGLWGFMPSFDELENPKSNLATEILTSDGDILGKYYIENRSTVHYHELPQSLVNALISTEDARFYKHSGIDFKAMFRVFFGVVTGSSKGGGSTLTQQLAKNLFPRGENLSKPGLVLRKFKEWITAIKLEHNYSKDEILAMYLTTVDFGSQSYGIKSAAKTFFNKTPDSLRVEEAALLVGTVNAPTRFSPIRNPQNAINRRNVVLKQMEKWDYITKEEYDSLSGIPLDMSNFHPQDHASGLAPYLREYLRGWLKEWCANHKKSDGTNYDPYKDGLKVYSTINSKMQKYAEEAVKEHLGKTLQPEFFKHWKGRKNAPFAFEPSVIDVEVKKLLDQAMKRSDRYYRMKKDGASEKEIREAFNTPVEMTVFSWNGDLDTIMSPLDSIKYYKYFLNAGLMSIDPHTGFVRAYVGGIDYRYFQFDHVIQSQRQVGSTFKPFVYALAMQEGAQNGEYLPCTKIPNVQPSIPLPEGGFWRPENSEHDREGEMVTLKWALANSINWISAQLIQRFSPQAVVQLVKNMGIKSEVPAVPSICLGTPDLTVYEMTGAMNTFANNGQFIEPVFITRIEDKYGNELDRFTPYTNEAMSDVTAYLTLSLMTGVVESGTGARLRGRYGLRNQIAGKTGTTQNNSDGWFVGIIPDLTTVIWVGAEDRAVHFRSTNLGQGANMALPIWGLFTQKLYADPKVGISSTRTFSVPPNMRSVNMNCSEGNPAGGGHDQSIDEDIF